MLCANLLVQMMTKIAQYARLCAAPHRPSLTLVESAAAMKRCTRHLLAEERPPRAASWSASHGRVCAI